MPRHALPRTEGEIDERIFAVAAWRDAPYFTDAERAALAIAEAVTRLSDMKYARGHPLLRKNSVQVDRRVKSRS